MDLRKTTSMILFNLSRMVKSYIYYLIHYINVIIIAEEHRNIICLFISFRSVSTTDGSNSPWQRFSFQRSFGGLGTFGKAKCRGWHGRPILQTGCFERSCGWKKSWWIHSIFNRKRGGWKLEGCPHNWIFIGCTRCRKCGQYFKRI